MTFMLDASAVIVLALFVLAVAGLLAIVFVEFPAGKDVDADRELYDENDERFVVQPGEVEQGWFDEDGWHDA